MTVPVAVRIMVIGDQLKSVVMILISAMKLMVGGSAMLVRQANSQ